MEEDLGISLKPTTPEAGSYRTRDNHKIMTGAEEKEGREDLTEDPKNRRANGKSAANLSYLKRRSKRKNENRSGYGIFETGKRG